MEELILDLKKKIIEALNLEEMTPADIDADDALFGDGDGLGLDSIDALELIVLMEKEYGAKPMIYTSEKLFKEHFSGKKYRQYKIFIANYRGTPTVRYTLWQFTEKGHVSGISGPVDISKFNRGSGLSDIKLPKKKSKSDDKSDTKEDDKEDDTAETDTTATAMK